MGMIYQESSNIENVKLRLEENVFLSCQLSALFIIHGVHFSYRRLMYERRIA